MGNGITGCDYIITHNFNHMTNEQKLKGANKINLENEYNEIIMITPETYLLELEQTKNKILTAENQYTIDSTKNHEIDDKISFEYILYEPDLNKKNKNALKLKNRVILSGEIEDITTKKPNEQNTYTITLQNYTTSSNEIKTTISYDQLSEEIKNLLPQTIQITESRLGRYNIFREPRDDEITIKQNLTPQSTSFSEALAKLNKNENPQTYLSV
jgi:hypothetical protein